MRTTAPAWLLVASLPWSWSLSCLPAQEGGAGLPPGARLMKKAAEDQGKLKQRYDERRANPVFAALPWQFDFAAAQQQAQREHKLVFCYFTRSYARCEACEEFEQEVLASPGFQAFAAKVVPFVHITTHIDGMAGDNLLAETGGNATPTLAFFTDSGEPLRLVTGKLDLPTIEAAFAKVQHWQRLRAAADAGQQDQQKELFLLELEMGNRPFAEMQQRSKTLAFDAAEQQRIEQQLVNLEFLQILKTTPMQKMAEAGGRFAAMYKAKRIPDTAQDTSFWQYAFAWAALQGDASLYAEMLESVKQTRTGDQRLMRYLPMLEQTLQQLRGKKGG